MLRRCEQHVFETAENVRSDRLAFVAAGERGHEHLCADGDAQMIRPERDKALDEWPLRQDTPGERGTAFGRRDGDESAPRLLARLPPLLIVALADCARGAERVGNGIRRALGRGAHHWCVPLQLGAKPCAHVADLLALARAGAEPESVEGAKSGVH